MYEYRVVWKREGQRKKLRKSRGLKTIQKWLWLLGDTPWKAFGKEPDDHVCCGGITYEEQAEQKKAEQPKIEYIKVEHREVGEWKEFTMTDTAKEIAEIEHYEENFCEVCLEKIDGASETCERCGREGFCDYCAQEGNHDCNGKERQ